MLEYVSISFLYNVVKDVLRWAKRPSPADIIRLRQKWKIEFEPNLRKQQHEGLRADVIIRDVSRFDSYPDLKETQRGISPWFRVGLVDTYHKGIQVGLGWEEITDADGRWRYTNHEISEMGGTKVILIGYIPYEKIESVDWDGDEYYSFPHIYCHFTARKGEPYERLAYCSKHQNTGGFPFYTEIAEYAEVRKRSMRLGIHR